MTEARDDLLNSSDKIPILITSSVIPHDPGVQLSDPKQRLFHAIESLTHWNRVAPRSRFVLCDGSNFDFRSIVEEKFPNMEIECLSFENDHSKILTHGRGYGEGEIIKFALQHSLFLRNTAAFAKCSSKLWVENYSGCINHFHGNCLFSGVFTNTFSFLKPVEMLQVDTRFYIVRSDFYRKNLIDAHHKIVLASGFGLEDSFYSTLVAAKQEGYLFPTPPVIMGVGGGTGKYYKAGQIRLWKEKIRLIKLKKSKNFQNLFN